MEKKTMIAYISPEGYLHATGEMDDALRDCRKKDGEKGIKGSTVVPTDWPFEHGNPVVDGKQVIMRAYNDIKEWGGGRKMDITADMAELIVLYKACDKE